MPADPGLLGVVLAGGEGRRLGGGKPLAVLSGRPLTAWVADALGALATEVVVAVKEGGIVPAVSGVAVWREPVAPVHPLAGIAFSLSRAGSRDVLVCAVDLPFCADAARAVVEAASRSGGGRAAGAVVAQGQPLLGVYRRSVADALHSAVSEGRPARAVVRELGAVAVPVPDPERTLFNVNTPDDLARAEAMVAGGCG